MQQWQLVGFLARWLLRAGLFVRSPKWMVVDFRVGPIWVEPIQIPIQIYSSSRYFCRYRYRYISTNISATDTDTDIFILADI